MSIPEEKQANADGVNFYSAPQTPLAKPTHTTGDFLAIHTLTIISVGICCGIAGYYYGGWQYERWVDFITAKGLTNDVPDFSTPIWTFIGFFAGATLTLIIIICSHISRLAFRRLKR